MYPSKMTSHDEMYVPKLEIPAGEDTKKEERNVDHRMLLERRVLATQLSRIMQVGQEVDLSSANNPIRMP